MAGAVENLQEVSVVHIEHDVDEWIDAVARGLGDPLFEILGVFGLGQGGLEEASQGFLKTLRLVGRQVVGSDGVGVEMVLAASDHGRSLRPFIDQVLRVLSPASLARFGVCKVLKGGERIGASHEFWRGDEGLDISGLGQGVDEGSVPHQAAHQHEIVDFGALSSLFLHPVEGFGDGACELVHLHGVVGFGVVVLAVWKEAFFCATVPTHQETDLAVS